MRTTLRLRPSSALALALAASTSLALASCGGPPPPPEGFTLAIQMMTVDVSVIDELRVTLTPQNEMGVVYSFEEIDTFVYDDGITIDDDPSTGALILTMSGDYVRSRATGGPTAPRVEIEMWSDDEMIRSGPQVRATVSRASEQIATGAGFLMQWPLPLGGQQQINVPCRMGFADRCVPAP